jgi:Ca-activated chloride channel family protein
MFDFHWPWALLLWPLPLLVWLIWTRRTAIEADGPQLTALLHPKVGGIEEGYGGAAPGTLPLDLVRLLLLALLWTALVGTLMQPQWLEAQTEIKTRGYDLMMAVDVSRSMEALDFTVEGRRVSRMAVVKGVINRFLERRHGDRVGLILFGDSAYMQAPLTVDIAAVQQLLDNAVPRMAGDATAIGDAIAVAVKKLKERPEGSRVLILVSDGENTSGSLPPLESAGLARLFKIRIYTIGVGTKGLVPFMEAGRMTMQKMEIDESLLREVARLTGGVYFRATDTRALEQIYQEIDTLEKTEAESRSILVPTPLFRWPLAAAMMALLGLVVLSFWRHRPL